MSEQEMKILIRDLQRMAAQVGRVFIPDPEKWKALIDRPARHEGEGTVRRQEGVFEP